MHKQIATALTLAALVAACGKEQMPTDADEATDGTPLVTAAAGQGYVYAATNAVSGNSVVVFTRASDGSLTMAGSYATGGKGTGAGLGSQGSLIVSDGANGSSSPTRAAAR